MKRYERLGKTMIRPLTFNESAYETAKWFYARYSRTPFHKDLLNYLRSGFVVSRRNLFGMAKVIEHDGRRGWFIQVAVGNILELCTTLPCQLDFVAFCREGDENMRVIDFELFVRKAAAIMKARAA